MQHNNKRQVVVRRPALFFLATFMLLTGANLTASQPFNFKAPVQITADTVDYNYRMSRNPNSQLQFDSSGTLHLVYWSGYFATNPTNPASIFYRSWTDSTGWTDEQIVDDSLDDHGRRMGGRHPSMAIDKDNTVWVAWHDHRHSPPEPPYNGINNLEVYCDKKPAGGEFSEEDIRLTQTSAAHFGDNAYCARIAAAPNGEVTVAWYDFHVDGYVSDIFMQTSDVHGNFDQTSPIISQRITNADNRQLSSGQPFKPAFNMPDFAITTSGQRCIIWSQDFGGSTGNSSAAPVYYAELGSQPMEVAYSAISPANDGYWFPPKLKLAPNGDLWVLYSVNTGSGIRQVELIKRAAGNATFTSPRRITSGGNNQNADMAIDADGLLHIAWVEVSGYQNNQVIYICYDYDSDTRLSELTVTPEPGPWESPALALDSAGLPHIVFGLFQGESLPDHGAIWFVQPEQDTSSISGWELY